MTPSHPRKRPITQDLVEAAFRLRRAAPDEWTAFIDQFERYSERILLGLLGADQGTILQAQGNAQQCREFMRLWLEMDRIIEEANKAEKTLLNE